jgi:hypothetical protein
MDMNQMRDYQDRMKDEQRRKEDAHKKLVYALQDIEVNRARYMQYGEPPLDWEAQKAEAIKAFKAKIGEGEVAEQNSAQAENVLPRITPDMLAVWTRLQEMKATQSARSVVNNTPDLRSDLWHAFIEMMTATMDGGE